MKGVTAHDVHARLAMLDIPSQIAAADRSALLLVVEDAAVLAELADYASRRGFTRWQAMQEIASRHPHPFTEDADSKPTCKACGRSEIFGIHRDQDGDDK